MITTIVGKPGTGKSLYLTKIVFENLQKGNNVFANYTIDENKLPLKKRLNYFIILQNIVFLLINKFRKKKLKLKEFEKPLGKLYYWTELEQFKHIEQAVIVMDEAQTYFSSRRWGNMTAEDEIKFQQHRKQGIDIYAGVQNLARCDKIIRELTAEVKEMHRWGKTFWFKTYEPEEIDKSDRSSSYTKFFRLDLQIANAYDTNELVNKAQWLKEQEEHLKSFILMREKIKLRQRRELPPALPVCSE